ncbi:hypothetical protein AQUCO_00900583v1 [Aquilegia coerulea]|uniref:Phytocyanin domain-containing protein n=1 Tax=Aquilegia coerulea TaxID=218851 RepID=A0A2G5EEG9_AQUCA|nr:hypothetical protein AQUCO_00900583v1 [Aquilegia coerulea]
MASKNIFAIVGVVLFIVILPIYAQAKVFIVGDSSGWTIGFDYKTWAKDKEFHVGDKLIFMYPVGAHNVHKVDADGFQNCTAPAGTEALKTGSDVITLATPGKKWYLCGVGKHCEIGGQKLAITVLSNDQVAAPAPTPVPSSSMKETVANHEN